jgi:hypothetical protein
MRLSSRDLGHSTVCRQCQLCTAPVKCVLEGSSQPQNVHEHGAACTPNEDNATCPTANECMPAEFAHKFPPAPHYVKTFAPDSKPVAAARARKPAPAPFHIWREMDPKTKVVTKGSVYFCNYAGPVAQIAFAAGCAVELACYAKIECSTSINDQEPIIFSDQHMCKAIKEGVCPSANDCVLDESVESRDASIASSGPTESGGGSAAPGKKGIKE